MLKKCLKHDLRYVYRVWIIATAIFVPISVIGGFAIRTNMLSTTDTPTVFKILSILGMTLFYLGSIGYAFIGAGMGMYRYYQTCYTDEGYLTFTLPVKRHTILNSKILSTVIPLAVSVLIMVICFHVTFSIVPESKYSDISALESAYKSMAESFSYSLEYKGFWAIVYAVQILIIILLAVHGAILAIFSIISRSPEAKKKPKRSFVKGLLIYFLSFPFIIVVVMLVLMLASYSEAVEIAGTVSLVEERVISLLVNVIITMLTLMLNASLYRDNLVRIREKLNLS